MTASARRENVSGNRNVTSILRWQHPFRIEDPNWHRSKPLHRECEWKQGDSAVGKYGNDLPMWRLPLVGGHLYRWHDQKSKSFLEAKIEGRDASSWSGVTFYGDTTKISLDSGSLLMEAARVSKRYFGTSATGC